MRSPLYGSIAVVAATALLVVGCGKKDEKKSPEGKAPLTKVDKGTKPEVPPGPAAPADGKRRVAVEVTNSGYQPSKVDAKAGEELLLVFTRTGESKCGEFVVVGDGDKVELPLNQPVEIPVTAPGEGELGFACGMNMMKGSIAVAAVE